MATFGKRGLVEESVEKRMGFYEAVKEVFGKYFVFSGRATRPEFWWFYLFYFITFCLLEFAIGVSAALELSGVLVTFTILTWIYGLACLVPYTSLTCRRLHDSNRSGWWMLIGFTGIGLLWVFWWTLKKSDVGENKFGHPA